MIKKKRHFPVRLVKGNQPSQMRESKLVTSLLPLPFKDLIFQVANNSQPKGRLTVPFVRPTSERKNVYAGNHGCETELNLTVGVRRGRSRKPPK